MRIFLAVSARTASRSELRDSPSCCARSSSLGSRVPGCNSPVTIIFLILSIASSVTAMAAPPLGSLLLLARREAGDDQRDDDDRAVEELVPQRWHARQGHHVDHQ